MQKAKLAILGLFALVLAVAVACGEEATPTPTPTTGATPTPLDVQSLVQQAVQQAIAAMPTPAPGVSAEDIPSIEEISSLVQAAIAASVPEGTSPEQIQQMVRAAVEAAAAPGVTREEVEQVVSAAVNQAVAQAVAQMTPVATPVPSVAPGGSVAPTGNLDVAFDEIGPLVFALKNQAFRELQFDHFVTHEAMFATAPDGTAIPRLVKSWSVDSSGLNYTFNLQEGAQWQQRYGDWGEFNADDFIFSINQLTLEGVSHTSASGIRRVFACDGCNLVKVDEYTVRLERPSPTIEVEWWSRSPLGGTLAMHSKKHYDAVGETFANNQSVGTGAWQLMEARAGEFRRAEAVQDHWRKTPNFAQVTWWEMIEESTRLANFQTGSLDTAKFTTDFIQTIRNEGMPGVRFMSFPDAFLQAINVLGMQNNIDHPAHQASGGEDARVPLGDDPLDCTLAWVSCEADTSSDEWQKALKVRLAMSMGIDRQKLVTNLAAGGGRPWYIHLWNTHDARFNQFGLGELTRDYDPARARQLLAEAGYADGFEIDAYQTGPFPAMEAVAGMWQDLGIEVKITNIPYSAFRPQYVRRTAKGLSGFDAFLAFPEPLRFYSLYYSAFSGLNQGFEHPDFQRLLDLANEEVDTEKRWAYQADMARWIFENAMVLSLFTTDAVWPLGPEIDAWAPMGGVYDWLSNWEYVPHRS